MTLRRFDVRGPGLVLAGIVLLSLVSAGCGVVASATTPMPSSAGSVDASTAGGSTTQPIAGPTAADGTDGAGFAYPAPTYPGLPGLAPDHTIVVTSTSQAVVLSDFSNRAAAQRAALTAALADAKAQAEIVASATGATISGVFSVSVSTSENFPGPVPPGVVAVPAPSSGTVSPFPQLPSSQMVAVTVTVAYRIV